MAILKIKDNNGNVYEITSIKGDKGDTGNGIKSIDITYAGSTSNTTVPTSGWQATPPSVAAGSYLWTRFIVSMTNNTSKTAYSVAKQGSTGAAAGFGTVTATVNNAVGTPSVTVTPSGIDTAKNFSFDFKNLKGDKGDTGAAAGFGTVTATVNNAVGTPSVTVTPSGINTAKNFSFDFKNLKGDKGDTGAAAGFDTPTASIGKNVGTPTVSVTASGENTKKKFSFTFDNLRGATFTPSVSEAGVLKWSCDNTALAKPADFDMVGKIQTAFSGGCKFQVLNSAPPTGTADTMISLVVDS